MTTRVFKIGLVGYGWWGRRLFDFFNQRKNVEMVAVHDVSENAIKDCNLAGARFYMDMEKMFDKEKMDGVIIATPPAHHLRPTRLAAERGIHVFCEKPMAHTVEDCDAMIKVCEANKVKLFVAFKHRYAGACRFLKKNMPEYGKCMWAMYTYPLCRINDPGWKFKEGECKGVILENTVHAIDNLRYLVGSDVERLYAEGGTYMFDYAKVPDSAIFTLRFKNGAIAALGGGSTSELVFTNEYLDIHYENSVAQMRGYLDSPFNLRVCSRKTERIVEMCFQESDGVKEEIIHFLECIEGDEQPLATGIDGREATRIALAALESATTNKIIHF
jgi:predicted dehydrogenase